MTWSADLIDTKGFSVGGTDLFLRLAASELEKTESQNDCNYCVSDNYRSNISCRKREKAEGIPNKYNFEVGQLELQEPPLYTYDMLRNATNNFDENNKLGEGGFGLVYKGILESRQVRAVKRLSTSSGQGLEEFMTELKVISKLQHRNLVKLLGCCIGDEKNGFSMEDYPSGSKT
ncbi:hypothetical protein RDABS01_031582 [Bienertia sinuspersici]